ncbi:DUF3331 domain-containing protein [Pararobbsia alpina]|uniref:DUF3331 domain-containing protein n=1 Tax=Pararobbsia alpina TaxID=621374 RepID=UPI0039A5FA50
MQNEATIPRVSVVEKLTSTTISVRWSDPCLGHYESQVWGIGLAQMDAVCVLSGKPIHSGDSIFRPRVNRTHIPINRHRMMLASAVACTPGQASY